MARIIVGGVNTNNTAPGPQSPNPTAPTAQPGDSAGKKLGKFLSDYYKIPIAMVIALVFYLVTRAIIPSEKITWWSVEIWTLVISLLVLWGVSEATKTKPEIGNSVFLFVLAMFIFFIVRGYNEHHVEDVPDQSILNEISIPVLGVGTHTFLLKNIGDDTGFFQYPDGDNYSGRISSQDYGYDIQYSDNTLYHGGPKVVIPPKPHGILKVVATSPNQYVRVVVHKY